MIQILHDQWQTDFLRCQGDKILCTGRQVGKSLICAEDAGEYAINNPKTEPIVMIAPTERQAYALFEKTLTYLVENYPKKVHIKGQYRPTKKLITLKSKVRIWCLPVGKTGLGIRFLTIGRLYVDEASQVPEDVWLAITPALLTTGGDSIYLSTPHGAKGEFHRCWINKDGAYDSFTRFSTDSEQVVANRPICETWTAIQREKGLIKLEQAKARMSRREYAQEYLGQFMEDLHRWFPTELIKELCVLKRPKIINPKADYYMGCDIARMGEDKGTIEIFDKINSKNIQQVENIVTEKQLTNETEDNIVNEQRKFKCRKIWIDAGSGTLGVSVLDHLLIRPETKSKVEAIDNKQRMLDDGKYKRLLKEDLYSNALALMEQRRVKFLDDEDIIASLSSIQYEYIMKSGEPTRLRIFGNDAHIAEGIIRALFCSQDKGLKLWAASTNYGNRHR